MTCTQVKSLKTFGSVKMSEVMKEMGSDLIEFKVDRGQCLRSVWSLSLISVFHSLPPALLLSNGPDVPSTQHVS